MINKSMPVIINRGLFGALCIIITVLANVKIAYASSTSDDLRAYLGMTVEKHEDEKDLGTTYTVGEDESVKNTDEEQVKKDADPDALDIAQENLSNLQIKLEQQILSNKPAYEILDTINELDASYEIMIQKGYDVSLHGMMSIDTSEYEDTTTPKQTYTYKSDKDINSVWYNIGYIGEDSGLVVDSTDLIKIYGYETEYNEETEEYSKKSEKNNSIWFKCTEGSDVKAQYNGVIFSTEYEGDSKKLNTVYINHSNGLFTVYKHVILNDNIKNGYTVTQGQVIGTVGKSDDSNETHLEFSVILDNKNINPLLIYGDTGKNLYNKFVRQYGNIYAVGKTEQYYWNDSLSTTNPNK